MEQAEYRIQVRLRPQVDLSGGWGSMVVLTSDNRPLLRLEFTPFNLRLPVLSFPNSATISVSGAPSLPRDDFHDPHPVSFGDLEGEENSKRQLSTDKTKNG